MSKPIEERKAGFSSGLRETWQGVSYPWVAVEGLPGTLGVPQEGPVRTEVSLLACSLASPGVDHHTGLWEERLVGILLKKSVLSYNKSHVVLLPRVHSHASGSVMLDFMWTTIVGRMTEIGKIPISITCEYSCHHDSCLMTDLVVWGLNYWHWQYKTIFIKFRFH